jgi:hypothetical protein
MAPLGAGRGTPSPSLQGEPRQGLTTSGGMRIRDSPETSHPAYLRASLGVGYSPCAPRSSLVLLGARLDQRGGRLFDLVADGLNFEAAGGGDADRGDRGAGAVMDRGRDGARVGAVLAVLDRVAACAGRRGLVLDGVWIRDGPLGVCV